MKRGMILVEALGPNGMPCGADVLDLDDESFRLFVLNVFWQKGAVAAIDPSEVTGQDIQLRMRSGAVPVIPFEQLIEEHNARVAAAAAAKPATADPVEE